MIGIDEVGRGCWAGPMLVVAAREISQLPAGLKDSKKLTKRQRHNLQAGIKLSCKLGEGWVSAKEIDALGLTAATRLGVKRALEALNASPKEQIIMDGTINYVPDTYLNVRCVARADDTYPIVSAAAIYAKVTRDNYMSVIAHKSFPLYRFDSHVGYGTALHQAVLELYGVSEIHRLSYKPVKLVKELT